MAQLNYENESTGLLVTDPYNDFISEGGKVWDRLKSVAEANQSVPKMKRVLDAARNAGIRVFYAMHHRYRPGDYENWKYIAPIQKAAWSRRTFEYGTWGGEFHPEFEPQPAMWWLRNIGAPVASLIRIWICNSRSTAFTS